MHILQELLDAMPSPQMVQGEGRLAGVKLLAAGLLRVLLACRAAVLQKETEAPVRHFTPEFPHEI